jgi:hypothetical protein
VAPALFLFFRQGIPREEPLFHRLVLDKMLLDEEGNALGVHGVIPGALGIDDHGRPLAADAPGAIYEQALVESARRKGTQLRPLFFSDVLGALLYYGES